MSLAERVIAGAYLRDILAIPEALRATVGRLEDLSGLRSDSLAGRWDRIVLTGMGSSFHGLHPLCLRLLAAGHATWMVETSELVHQQPFLLTPRTLLVVASQSGRSAETLRLLEGPARGLTLVGVTNTADSPLASAASVLLLTRAGEEATVSCKTYAALTAALDWLGEALVGGELSGVRSEWLSALPSVSTYLGNWQSHVDTLGELMGDADIFFHVGRGASLAAAQVAGLITKESTRHPSEGMSSAAFRHGPFEMLSPRVLVLAYSGAPGTAPINSRLVADIQATGARAAAVAEDALIATLCLPPLPVRTRPVFEMLPAHLLTLAIAARGDFEAGRFERATKVTSVE